MHVTQALRVPEVARRLGLSGTEVYGLIDRGELAAGKADGLVYVTEEAVEEFRRGRGASTAAS